MYMCLFINSEFCYVSCFHATVYICHFYPQKTATKAVVEMCEGDDGLGDGFQLLVGLAEIHVPRMWVEENDQSHHVRSCDPPIKF